MVSASVAVIVSALVAVVSSQNDGGSCNYQSNGDLTSYRKTLGPYYVNAGLKDFDKVVYNSECNNNDNFGYEVSGLEVTACAYEHSPAPSVTFENVYDGMEVEVMKNYAPATVQIDVYCRPYYHDSKEPAAPNAFRRPAASNGFRGHFNN